MAAAVGAREEGHGEGRGGAEELARRRRRARGGGGLGRGGSEGGGEEEARGIMTSEVSAVAYVCMYVDGWTSSIAALCSALLCSLNACVCVCVYISTLNTMHGSKHPSRHLHVTSLKNDWSL